MRKVSDPRVSSIKIISNHYHVRIGDIEKIYIYSIKFTPMIVFDNKTLRNHLLEIAMPQIRQNIGNYFFKFSSTSLEWNEYFLPSPTFESLV